MAEPASSSSVDSSLLPQPNLEAQPEEIGSDAEVHQDDEDQEAELFGTDSSRSNLSACSKLYPGCIGADFSRWIRQSSLSLRDPSTISDVTDGLLTERFGRVESLKKWFPQVDPQVDPRHKRARSWRTWRSRRHVLLVAASVLSLVVLITNFVVAIVANAKHGNNTLRGRIVRREVCSRQYDGHIFSGRNIHSEQPVARCLDSLHAAPCRTNKTGS